MENWKKTTLGSVVTFQRGHDLPESEFNGGEYPVYGSNGIAGYHDQFTTNGNAIVIGRSGSSVGKSAFVDVDFWAHNTCLYSKEFNEVYPKFVFYLIKTLRLDNYNGGSAIPTLNRNYINPIKISIPTSIETQKNIAQFLDKFIKKIEHNISLNETLTALTEAIFRKVYQDTEGVGVFGDLTTQVSTRLGEQADKEKIAVLSAVKTGHLVRTEDYFSKQVFSDDISNYKRVAPLAFAYNPARANIGSMGMNDLNTEGAVSPVYEVFKAKETYHYWVLMLLKHPNIKRGIEGLCSGTVRQNLKFSDLASLNIKIPDAKAVASFNVEYEKLKKRFDHNLRQNETLIALRDGLLPKLMTGQITL